MPKLHTVQIFAQLNKAGTYIEGIRIRASSCGISAYPRVWDEIRFGQLETQPAANAFWTRLRKCLAKIPPEVFVNCKNFVK